MRIESLQNPRVKRLVALQQKRRERTKHGLFVVEGEREISRALTCEYDIVELWMMDEFDVPINLDESMVIRCSPAVFQKISYRGEAAKYLAVFKMKEMSFDSLKLPKTALIITLENIEKPGNLGAVLRSANAFGADAVVVCDSSVDIYNPNVIRNSLGGFFDLPIVVSTSEQAISFFQKNNVQMVTTHLEASMNYLDVDYTRSTALIMGAESTGLSNLWVKNTNQNVIIKMGGVVDSLNISVAAAVVMSEVARQRAHL